MVKVGDVVREYERDAKGNVRIVKEWGRVRRIFFRTWGKRKGAVHSISTNYQLVCGYAARGQSLAFVLHWVMRSSRWRNRLDVNALYEIVATPSPPDVFEGEREAPEETEDEFGRF